VHPEQLELLGLQDFQDLQDLLALWVPLEFLVQQDFRDKLDQLVNQDRLVQQDNRGKLDKMGCKDFQVDQEQLGYLDLLVPVVSLDQLELRVKQDSKGFLGQPELLVQQEQQEFQVHLAQLDQLDFLVLLASLEQRERLDFLDKLGQLVFQALKVLQEPLDFQVLQALKVTKVILVPPVKQERVVRQDFQGSRELQDLVEQQALRDRLVKPVFRDNKEQPEGLVLPVLRVKLDSLAQWVQ